MINLMYIVLTAMLALNVSSDVLNGFRQVEEGLVRTTENVAAQNESLYDELSTYYHNNPEKSGEWYHKATAVHQHTDSLYDYIATLKQRIVREADGKNGDVNNIERQDDLEAASFIMLSPTTREGRKLREALIGYSEMVNEMISDTVKQRLINEYLYPRMSKTAVGEKKTTWEEANFENMPVIAAITLLTKIQSDLRSAESEILHTLLKNIDKGDVRVNQLNAYVIPSSKTVIRGSKYSANIVLARQPAEHLGTRCSQPRGIGFGHGRTHHPAKRHLAGAALESGRGRRHHRNGQHERPQPGGEHNYIQGTPTARPHALHRLQGRQWEHTAV